jgi:NitT/TauT family transport system substrate-binding protein
MSHPTPARARRLVKCMPRAAFIAVLLAAVCVSALSGCTRSDSGTQVNGRTKIKVGYIGLTCEAPLFIAKEKGLFEEEGLDVEMVRCEWATYKDALALGRYDVTHHLTGDGHSAVHARHPGHGGAWRRSQP